MKKESWNENEEADLIGRLIPWYKKHIETSIDWGVVEKQCKSDPQKDEEGDLVGYSLLGTVFQIMPSGKYWTFWACSNTTQRERIKDTAFSEALNAVTEEHGYWIELGEGDPCDLFIVKSYESENEEL